MIHAKINGIEIQVPESTTILAAAQKFGFPIPTMCYLKDLAPEGACRMCLVEIAGREKLMTACSTKLEEGMEVLTESERVIAARKTVLGLLLSNHPANCMECSSSGICKLQEYCIKYEVDEARYKGVVEKKPIDESNPYIVYDPNLCVLCRKCERVCNQIMKNGAIAAVGKASGTAIGTAFARPLAETSCDSCGNCVDACSTGALSFKRQKSYHVWEPQRKVRIVCPACEEGCLMDLYIRDWKVIDVKGVEDGPRGGMLCAKGRFESMELLQEAADAKIGFLK